MTNTSVGFIGLGAMGSGMAANLLAKGFPLTVMANRRREAVDRLVSEGAVEVASPKAMADGVDIVVLCVTGSPQVQSLIFGDDGIMAAGKPLSVIDCSTSDPAVTLQLFEVLKSKGITLIDAPLSRTPKEAAAGTLDVMVGADPEVFDCIRPVIDAFAGRIVHTGAVGTAHTVKLLNNFVAMGYAALYSEALALGAKAGLSPKVFDAVIRDGRMDSPFFRTFFDYVINRNEKRASIHDRQCAEGHDLPGVDGAGFGRRQSNGRRVRNSLASAAATGNAQKYVPMLSDVIAELNGVKLTDRPLAIAAERQRAGVDVGLTP